MAKKNKSSIFNLFNSQKEGKGVPKSAAVDPLAPRNLMFFFKLFWRNISNLFTLNMYIVMGNFPVLIFMFGLSGNLNINTNAASSIQYGVYYGVFNDMPLSPLSGALHGVYGIPSTMQIFTTATYVLLALGALVLFTFGPVQIGITYVMRNIVRGEPLFMWHDFTNAIKRNWKQGLVLGIIDVLAALLFAFDFIFFLANTGSFANNMMFAAMTVICIYFIMMRFYMYLMAVTFDLKIIKIIKNSLIFALLNFKRNLVAVIGIVLLVFFNYYLFLVFMPLGIMFPFVLLFSSCSFMGIYAAWPKIKEVMVDPYEAENPPEPTKDPEDPIFRDMG